MKRKHFLLSAFIISAGIIIPGATCGEKGDKTAPLPPTNLQAQAKIIVGGSKVVLTYEASPSSDTDKYKIYRALQPFEISEDTYIGETGGTSFDDTGVESGNEYYYRVTAVDRNNNESIPTDEVSVSLPIIGASCGNSLCESGENSENCPSDCGTGIGNICDSNMDALRIASVSPADGGAINTGSNTFSIRVEYNLVTQPGTPMLVDLTNETASVLQSQMTTVSAGCGMRDFTFDIAISNVPSIVYFRTYFISLPNIYDSLNYYINGKTTDWISITSSVPTDGSIIRQGNVSLTLDIDYILSSAPNADINLTIQDDIGNIFKNDTIPVSQGTGTQNKAYNFSTRCASMVYASASLATVGYTPTDTVAFPLAIYEGVPLNPVPVSLDFVTTVGVYPPPQNINIYRCGGVQEVDWVATVDVNWLSIAPTTSGTTPFSINVNADITDLTIGVYNGNVVLSSPQAPDSQITVPVKLTVNP